MAIGGFQWHKQFHSCLEIEGYLKKAKNLEQRNIWKGGN